MLLNPVAILLFILVAIVIRVIEARKKQGTPLPPLVPPTWGSAPRHDPAPTSTPKSASDRPYVQDADPFHPAPREVVRRPEKPAPRVAPAPVRAESRSLPDRSPHEIAERELTTAGELDAPAGSALARLQASIEERRLALERRHAKGVSIRSADRGTSA